MFDRRSCHDGSSAAAIFDGDALVQEEFFGLEGLFDHVNVDDFSAPGVFSCCNCGASSWSIGCDDDDWVCNNCGVLDTSFAFSVASSPEPQRNDDGAEKEKTRGNLGGSVDGGEVVDMELSGYVCRPKGKYDRMYYLRQKLRNWLAKKSGIAEGARNLIGSKLEEAFVQLEQTFDEVASIVDPGVKKSFSNYPQMLYNLLEMYDRVDLADDVKIVENKKTRKHFALYWWFFCKKLGWPMISKDVELLKRNPKLKL